MPDKIKSPILILIVLIVLSLTAAGGVFFFLQKEKAKNVAMQEEMDDILTRLRVTENKLDTSNKSIIEISGQLDQAQGKIATLTSDLEQERASKDQALAQADQMRMALEQQKSLKAELDRKLSDAQKQALKLESQLKSLQDEKGELEAKVKSFQEQSGQGVELGKIIVGTEVVASAKQVAAPVAVKKGKPKPKQEVKDEVKDVPAAANLEGKILVVNKDYNFAVLDLGTKEGVNIGDVFSVYRKNKYLGDVKVEKVHDSMSAAGFASADMNTKVVEGDKVVRKAK